MSSDCNDLHHKAFLATPAALRIVQAAHAVLDYKVHTGRVHYTESSNRMTIVRHKLRPPFHEVIYEDCSSFATGCYWIAGVGDPNGFGYNGLGFTGTLCVHGRRVKTSNAHPADLVFYGSRAPWGHVAVCVGQGKVISHGHEGAPELLPIDYRPVGEVRRYV